MSLFEIIFLSIYPFALYLMVTKMHRMTSAVSIAMILKEYTILAGEAVSWTDWDEVEEAKWLFSYSRTLPRYVDAAKLLCR